MAGMAECDPKFSEAQGPGVIITSKQEITSIGWRRYMKKHWRRLARQNTVFLILAGVHGDHEGHMGPPDQMLLKDSHGQVRVLKRQVGAELCQAHDII